MSTSSLWRTERLRFPLYSPDGRGRDYYIKYDNGGYWADQFQLIKSPDYERPHYKNFHTLFHQAAPFKYWGDGHGRETYIIHDNGLFHNQKPLYAYKLSDFLRNDNNNPFLNKYKKRIHMSVSEKKYNNVLRQLEKKLIKRLYTEPMNLKKSLIQGRNINDYIKDPMRKTFTSFPIKNIRNNNNEFNFCCNEILKTNDDSSLEHKTLEKFNENFLSPDAKNKKIKIFNKFNKTCGNFYKDKNGNENNLNIKTDSDSNNFSKKRAFKNLFDYNKIYSTITCVKPRNDLRFLEPKNKYNKIMKIPFKFKTKPTTDKIKIKNIKII